MGTPINISETIRRLPRLQAFLADKPGEGKKGWVDTKMEAVASMNRACNSGDKEVQENMRNLLTQHGWVVANKCWQKGGKAEASKKVMGSVSSPTGNKRTLAWVFVSKAENITSEHDGSFFVFHVSVRPVDAKGTPIETSGTGNKKTIVGLDSVLGKELLQLLKDDPLVKAIPDLRARLKASGATAKIEFWVYYS